VLGSLDTTSGLGREAGRIEVVLMKLKVYKINDIRPAHYNPRKDLTPEDPEWRKIEKSITEFGYVEPLVINTVTGNLISGHQRLKVMKAKGVKTIPVIEVEISDKDGISTDRREKALNIALNKISGEWDYPALKEILIEELDLGDLDIEITGFDQDELTALINSFKIDEEIEEGGSQEPKMIEVVCPECGHKFETVIEL
jgi:ParB-like chromosome segregation protein Spo0J